MTPAEILGVSPDATAEQAKAAYRRLAQLYHPDKPEGNLGKFQEIGRALKDFRRKILCPDCAGKGFIETRSGLAVKRDRCPKCWNTTITKEET